MKTIHNTVSTPQVSQWILHFKVVDIKQLTILSPVDTDSIGLNIVNRHISHSFLNYKAWSDSSLNFILHSLYDTCNELNY